MRWLWKQFWSLNFWLKLIWIFCFLGMIFNLIYVCRDLRHDGILLRLHTGFLILYAGQVVFLLIKERMVFVLSLLQAGIALETNVDFTFVPVLRLLGQIIYSIKGGFTLEEMEVYKYVFVSACFTLELLKTYFMFALLPPPKKKPKPEPEPAEEK